MMTPRCQRPLSSAPSYTLEEGHSHGATRLSEDTGLSLLLPPRGKDGPPAAPRSPRSLEPPRAMERSVLVAR